MIKKSARLSRAQFNEYFKTGRRFNSPALTLVYSPHERFHGSVVVGKKVATSAVRRNAIRRRIYELLRQHYQTTKQPGVYIIITKPAFNSLTRSQAQAEVQNLLEKTTKGA